VKKYIPQPIRNEIVYANPCKSLIDLAYAQKIGSPLTVVDSFEELDKLADVKYEGGALIRIAVDDSQSKIPFSGKFGLPPSQVRDIGDYAASKKIQIKGISFHVGSGGNDGKVYYKSIRTAQQLCNELGEHVKIIDIGGGFLSCEKDFEAKTKFIKAAYDPHFQYIAEPGRFFSHTCQDFFVKVIGKKPWSGGWRYTIDDSLYGQFSCIPFDHAKPLWVRVADMHEEKRRKTKGILMGRTCDSVDVIARCEHMEELEVGDWLWFPHMGSYTNATANEFNGFPKPQLRNTLIETPNINDICFIDSLPEHIETISPLSSAALLKN
jgi:ornithine decarboxylase